MRNTQAVGQRWQYITTSFYILAEITSLSPFQTIILQSNDYAITHGYRPGRTDRGGMGMDQESSTDWHYMEGQDKPI